MLVYGAPIEWETTGPLLVRSEEEAGMEVFPSTDYTWLTVDEELLDQLPRPGTAEARLRARWEGLEDEKLLTWQLPADPSPSEPEVEEEEEVPGGCGCDRPGPLPAPPLPLLALPLPLLLLRRAPRRPPVGRHRAPPPPGRGQER
jgi:hypothetical protein